LLNARYAQTCKAMGLERASPEEELFFRQLVPTASFLESNFAATYRGDHRGLAADHPSLGSRGRQAFRGRSSDRRPTGERIHRAIRGFRGFNLARARSVVSRPAENSSPIPAVIVSFHRPPPRASLFPLISRSFDAFERVCHQFFKKKPQSPLRNESSPSPAIRRPNRRLTPLGRRPGGDLVKCVHLDLSVCNPHAENGPIHRRRKFFTYYSR
jgi:hypothetical protein